MNSINRPLCCNACKKKSLLSHMRLHIVRFVLCMCPILILGAVSSQCTAPGDRLQLSDSATVGGASSGYLYPYVHVSGGRGNRITHGNLT